MPGPVERGHARALKAAGKDVTLYEYPGEDHRFDRSWARFMHRAVAFLRARARLTLPPARPAVTEGLRHRSTRDTPR